MSDLGSFTSPLWSCAVRPVNKMLWFTSKQDVMDSIHLTWAAEIEAGRVKIQEDAMSVNLWLDDELILQAKIVYGMVVKPKPINLLEAA